MSSNFVIHPRILEFLVFQIHCNLVITLMMGAKRKEHYNEMSIITK